MKLKARKAKLSANSTVGQHTRHRSLLQPWRKPDEGREDLKLSSTK